MIERECPVCGNSFQTYPSRVAHGRGIHCSRECQYAANRAKLTTVGKISLTCVACGDEFERYQSETGTKVGGGKYCSRACRDAHWVGENTPNWQGGNGVYKRGPHWYSTRRTILKRDGYRCQHCGSGDDLHVHHKVPFRMFNDADIANHESNLITLCASCHRVEDAKSKWVKLNEAIIHMPANGYAWDLAKNLRSERASA